MRVLVLFDKTVVHMLGITPQHVTHPVLFELRS